MTPLTRGQVAQKMGIGIEDLRFARRAKAKGFSTEITELPALRVDPTTTGAQVRAEAQAKVADIQSKIRDLRRLAFEHKRNER